MCTIINLKLTAQLTQSNNFLKFAKYNNCKGLQVLSPNLSLLFPSYNLMMPNPILFIDDIWGNSHFTLAMSSKRPICLSTFTYIWFQYSYTPV